MKREIQSLVFAFNREISKGEYIRITVWRGRKTSLHKVNGENAEENWLGMPNL